VYQKTDTPFSIFLVIPVKKLVLFLNRIVFLGINLPKNYLKFFQMEKPWDKNTELLLVVAHFEQNLDWLISQKDFPYVLGRKFSTDPICGVPIDKGADGATYLKFIINNWNDLPKRLCFLDDHERSWHQEFDMIEKLRKIKNSTGWPKGFFPLNDLPIDSMEEFRHWKYELFSPVWDAVVKPHIGMDCPTRIIADGSSQFIVSREYIHANSIALYQDLYEYNIGTKRWKGDEEWRDASGYSYAPGGQDWVGGAYFLEWIWHLVFNTSSLADTSAIYADRATD
jgi:hypothetical protein